MTQVTNRKIEQKLLNPAKSNTSKEIVLCICHQKLIKSGVNIETQFRNVT